LGVCVIEATADESLSGMDGIFWILYGLSFCDITDEAGAVLGEGDN